MVKSLNVIRVPCYHQILAHSVVVLKHESYKHIYFRKHNNIYACWMNEWTNSWLMAPPSVEVRKKPLLLLLHWLFWSLSVDHSKLWEILQEIGIPDIPYLPPEKSVCRSRAGHGTTDWFQIGKGVSQGCILSPCLFNLYAEYIMQNAGLDEPQAGIKIAGRNINKLRYADAAILMAESTDGTEEPLDKGERGEWKSWLKTQHSQNQDHGILSHYFMRNRWHNNGNSDRLYFLGLQNPCGWWLQSWN